MEKFIPVVVIKELSETDRILTALKHSHINCAEITFRTACAAEAIAYAAQHYPDMEIGAGTVINAAQCEAALAAGATFIVSPGLSPAVAKICNERNIPYYPGCVTPTEIMAAMKHGLKLVKFFPANVYGGLNAMKNLSAPFVGIKFLPTGGVNSGNIKEYIDAPFIHAVGGSWVCPKADIAAGNFEKITALCKQARSAALGFEVAHIGVNCENGEDSLALCKKLDEAFSLGVKEGNSSNFASNGIEVMKSMYLGKNGHIAIRTNSVPLAVAELEKKGFVCDMETAKYKGERMIAVYLKEAFGGFAVHLLQK